MLLYQVLFIEMLSYQRLQCYIFRAAETHSHVTNYIKQSLTTLKPKYPGKDGNQFLAYNIDVTFPSAIY